jgi:8-oxo-dGTP pyrophosphatase MutT (NUDIX family)
MILRQMKRALSSTSSAPVKAAKKLKMPEKVSAGIYLQHNDSIFLVQPTGSSGYGIPKGYVEGGETTEEAARREFSEETGIDVSSIPLVYLEGSSSIKGGKKINAFIGIGDGTETFVSCNLITEGFRAGKPENSGGRYFSLAEASTVIHKNQANLLQLFKEHFETETK